jgi:transcriptional regulator with XRE-family HTH domain
MVSEVWDLLDRTFVPKIASRSGRAAVDYRQIGIRPVARYSHAQERVGRQHKQSLQPFGTGKGVIEGHRIKSIRRRLGLTQKALAEAMKVDQGTISRWERGVEAPRPGRQAMLEKLLDVQDEHLALARARAFVRVNGGVKLGHGAAQNWATLGLRETRVMGGGQSAALSM